MKKQTIALIAILTALLQPAPENDRLQYNIGTSRLADEFASGQCTEHAGKHINRQPLKQKQTAPTMHCC